MFSAFRSADYASPDGFMASLGKVLAQYPDDVIMHVTSPETGIQRTAKFAPTLSEVVDACNARVAEQKRLKRLQNWGEANAVPALEAPKKARSSLAELKAKYGDNWGIADIDPVKALPPHPKSCKAMPLDQVIEHYKTHDLAFKPKENLK